MRMTMMLDRGPHFDDGGCDDDSSRSSLGEAREEGCVGRMVMARDWLSCKRESKRDSSVIVQGFGKCNTV